VISKGGATFSRRIITNLGVLLPVLERLIPRLEMKVEVLHASLLLTEESRILDELSRGSGHATHGRLDYLCPGDI
jgi:hypothetical protein